MSLLNNRSRFRGLLVVALSCFVSAKGFAQLIYLTDTRSVSGSASVTDVSQYNSGPYYTTSYSGDYSGSAAPSSQFGDFQGNANGGAIFQGGLNLPGGNQSAMTISSSVAASQNSFLHLDELYFSAFESSSGSPGSLGQPSTQWSAQGSSSLQVTFQVLSPIDFNFLLQGTGDPSASSDDFSLSSSGQGVLFSGNSESMLQKNEYGTAIDYSGTFMPGNTYTMTLDSQGGLDGGGLIADMVVPEPSMTALAGLALVIFLLKVRMNQRMATVKIPRSKTLRGEGRGSRG